MNSDPAGALAVRPMNGCGGEPNGTVAVQTAPTPTGGVVQLIPCGVPNPGPEIWDTLPAPLPENSIVSVKLPIWRLAPTAPPARTSPRNAATLARSNHRARRVHRCLIMLPSTLDNEANEAALLSDARVYGRPVGFRAAGGTGPQLPPAPASRGSTAHPRTQRAPSASALADRADACVALSRSRPRRRASFPGGDRALSLA